MIAFHSIATRAKVCHVIQSTFKQRVFVRFPRECFRLLREGRKVSGELNTWWIGVCEKTQRELEIKDSRTSY
jgi:hypothetical protein